MAVWRVMQLMAWLLTLHCMVHGRNPGLNVQLTKYGINYVASEFTKEGLQTLIGEPIPDVSDSTDTGIGKIDYSLTGMTIQSAALPITDITIPVPNIHAHLAGASIAIHGDWHYKLHSFIPVEDSGSFDASLSSGSLDVTVSLGVSGGKPTLSTISCSSDLSNIDIDIHGGASFIYNWLIDFFKDDISDNAQKAVCQALTKYIATVNQQAQKLDLIFAMSDELTADVTLLAAPNVTTETITAFMKGEIFWKQNYTESPHAPAALPSAGDTTKMMNVWVSEYTVNTLGEVMQNNGAIVGYFTKDDLPDGSKFVLNTTCPGQLCIGAVIPKLAEAFPNCSVAMNLSSISAPTVDIKPIGTGFNFQLRLDYDVILPNGSLAHAFATNNSLHMVMDFNIKENKVYGHASNFTASTKLVESDIGPISDGALTYVITEMGQNVVLPKLNAAGTEGLNIPLGKDVVIVKSDLIFHETDALLSADILYQPHNLAKLLFTHLRDGQKPILQQNAINKMLTPQKL